MIFKFFKSNILGLCIISFTRAQSIDYGKQSIAIHRLRQFPPYSYKHTHASHGNLLYLHERLLVAIDRYSYIL